MLAQQCADLSTKFSDPAVETVLGIELSSAAFALVIHGEIESALETGMMDVASAALHLWKHHLIICYPMAALMWANRKSQNEPPSEAREGPFRAFKAFESQIKKNHGVRQESIEKLGGALGARLPITVLGQLERFSSVRGELAHTASGHIRTLWSIDDMVSLAKQVQDEVLAPLHQWTAGLRALSALGDDTPPAGLAP